MNDQGVIDNNERHNARLKQCEDWVTEKASNKINKPGTLKRPVKKTTINKKTPKKGEE